MIVREICGWMDGIAPFDTAESYDNVGLLIGSPHAKVDKVLFCLDVTEDVVEEAVAQGAQLIISHHPLLFGGITRIDYTKPAGRVLCAMVQARLNLIAAHTNWDKAPGGVADSLGAALGLESLTAEDEYIRLGILPAPMDIEDFSAHVQKVLEAPVRRYGDTEEPISRVAVGPGACGEKVTEAAAQGAQVFVVGEIKHHELLFACEQGMVVLETGHFATEMGGMTALYHRFQKAAAQNHWQVQPLLYSKAPFSGACRKP